MMQAWRPRLPVVSAENRWAQHPDAAQDDEQMANPTKPVCNVMPI